MAANCALFWTSNGWDGSEEMMLKSRLFCTRVPSLRRISFTSVSAATTLIVTIQGVQSVYSPLQGFFDGNYAFSVAFDSIFYSLAFLGLMRLPAALWLTEDYSYVDIDRMESTISEEMGGVEMEAVTTKPGSTCTPSTVDLLARDSGLSISREEMFHSSNSWRGILIRIHSFSIPLIGSVALTTAYIGQSQPGYGLFFTGTYLVLISFYLVLTVGVYSPFLFTSGRGIRAVLFCRVWGRRGTRLILGS